jgi:hypothetical protein
VLATVNILVSDTCGIGLSCTQLGTPSRSGARLIIPLVYLDRPLQHINKKGRPVSQCQHCRSMRKSRSAHTKCDCGEKMFKCAHLKTTVEGHKGEHRNLILIKAAPV